MKYEAFRVVNQRFSGDKIISGIWVLGQRPDTLNWEFLPLTFATRADALESMKAFVELNDYPANTPIL